MILEIATLRIKLTFNHDYHLFTDYISNIVDKYKQNETTDYDVELITVKPEVRPTLRYSMEPRNDAFYFETDDCFIFEKDSWASIINWKQKTMFIMFFSDTNPESRDHLFVRSLKLLISLLALQKGGLPCHCSAATKNNDYGVLFCGPSNFGKTTIALLLHRHWTVFNDEYNIIMPQKNSFTVFSTPFTTSEKFKYCSKGSARVKKIFYLGKGAENKTAMLTPKQKYLSLLGSTYTFPTSESFGSAMMKNAEQISREIPMEKLYFNLGIDIIDIIDTIENSL